MGVLGRADLRDSASEGLGQCDVAWLFKGVYPKHPFSVVSWPEINAEEVPDTWERR
jgi:hypothetical protein